MPDSSFFVRKGPFLLGELAKIANAGAKPGDQAARTITDIAPLDEAGGGDISFFDNRRYREDFRNSAAGACIVRPEDAKDAPEGMCLLTTETPYKAYALIAQAFYPEVVEGTGVHPSANIHPSVLLGADVEVGPGVAIGPQAIIGNRCRIAANAVIGASVRIGDACHIGPGASVRFSLVGDDVRIFAGARIGEDGFGFAPDAGGHLKVPQLGRVVIGNDVEIGANTTIDRGSGPDTVVGDGCRIDNLVQIGHNVRLGRGCIVVAQAGISGSTIIGDFAVIAAQAGLTGHLHIGQGAQIAAQSGVMRDVPDGKAVAGSPAVPRVQYFRQVTALARLVRQRKE